MKKKERFFIVPSDACIRFLGMVSPCAAKLYFLLLSHIQVDPTTKKLFVSISQRTLATKFYTTTEKGRIGKHNSSISRHIKELVDVGAIKYIRGYKGKLSTYIVGYIEGKDDVLLIESDAPTCSLCDDQVITSEHQSDYLRASSDALRASQIEKVITSEHQGDALGGHIYNPYNPNKNNPYNPNNPQNRIQKNNKTTLYDKNGNPTTNVQEASEKQLLEFLEGEIIVGEGINYSTYDLRKQADNKIKHLTEELE